MTDSKPTKNVGKPSLPEPDRSSASWLQRNAQILRFVGVTAVGLVGLYWILHLRTVVTGFVDPYTGVVAECSRTVLRLIGIKASGTGDLITSPGFSVSIKNVCNGLEVTAIFLAVTLAFPASWRNRLIGIAIGYPMIFAINIVRIVALFLIGLKMPGVFESAHYYYAQAFVIIATVGVWLVWVSTLSEYGTKVRNSIPG
jgi:exosortase H (IPTLxxWG-CTERM-specific)